MVRTALSMLSQTESEEKNATDQQEIKKKIVKLQDVLQMFHLFYYFFIVFVFSSID